MSALPPASLIIGTRNRGDMLLDSVQSILAGRVLPAELIIIDQSDAPLDALAGLASVEERCDVRYVHSTTRGLSRANNAGVRMARHDLLVFTHDDVRVEPDWFGNIVRALIAAGSRAIITGQVPPTAPERPDAFAGSSKADAQPARYNGRIGRDVLKPLNMAMYRTAIEEVGGFDERIGPGTAFPAAEDNDLGLRLLEAGFEIRYEPAAILHHRAWRPASEYFDLRWCYGRGQGAYWAKHTSVRDRYILKRFLRDIHGHTFRAVRRMRGQRREGRGDLVYLAGVISAAAQWWLTGVWLRDPGGLDPP